MGTVTSTYKSGYVYANNRSQEYKKNSVYTISATPKSGYRFVSWSDGGAQTHDITITGNQTYTATFESLAGQQYTVTTAVNNNSLGSVTPIGYQYENTNWDVAVTINDPANYYLSDWLRDGVSMGVRTNPLPVTVTKAETYTAVITAKEWTLTVNSDNTSLGTVSGGKKCYDGETTTITATPANSFTSFVKWQKNGVDYAGGASINVTVNANDTYTAFFSGRNIIEVDIPNATYVDRNAIYSLRGNSNGTSSENSGYYVDVACNTSNNALSSVDGIKYNGSTMSFTTKTIESIEQPCGNRKITNLACYNATGDVYMFKIHWTQPWGEDSNDTYPNDRTINANQQAAYDDDLGAIYVYGYTKEYEWNGQATLRAMGMYFVTGQRCSDDIKIPVGTYEINCSGDPGTVMSYQSGMDKDLSGGWAQTQGVEHGYYLLDKGTVTVTKSGSTYTINVNAKNSYGNDLISTMTIDESVISGTIPNYTLNVTTDGHGTAKVYRYDCSGNENLVSNSGSYKQGSYFKLEATPASGYAFDYWTIDGVDEHFTNNPEILDGLYDNAVVTAHFKTAVMHTVTISTPTNGTITVMDGETTINNGDQVEEGTVLTVTATPATGYHFDSWVNNGAASVTVNSDVTIGATFAINTYTVTIAAYPKNAGYGTLQKNDETPAAVLTFTNVPHNTAKPANAGTGNQAITFFGNTVTPIPAEAANGYTYAFSGWGNATSKITSDREIKANFTRTATEYTITYNNYDISTYPGTLTTIYTVETQTITLPFAPNVAKEGYTFGGWYDNEELTGTPVTSIAQGSTGNKEFWAKWEQKTYTVTIAVDETNNYGTVSATSIAGVPHGATITVSDNTITINGATVTVTAADADDLFTYSFSAWKNGETTLTGNSNTVTEAMTITAHFARNLKDVITLNDMEDAEYYNNFATAYDSVEVGTVTYHRTFTANRWSTICLPFDAPLVSPLKGNIFEFQHATGNANVGGGIYLYFSTAKQIVAGRAYLVRFGKAPVSNSYTFYDVKINTSADKNTLDALVAANTGENANQTEGTISLIGTLRKFVLPTPSIYYMALYNNKIYYPGTNTTVPAYRAFFYDSNPSGVQQRVRIVVDGVDMGEMLIDNGELLDAGGDDRAPRKYIRNGVLVIECNGVTYDAQGKRL